MPPTKRSYLKYQEATPVQSNETNALFSFIRMLFSGAGWILLFFCQFLASIILELQLLTFPFNNVLGYTLQLINIFPFWWLNLPLRERNNFTVKFKRIIILYLPIFNTKLYPFQNISLGFILIKFLQFRKFQPRYIKYILIKNRVQISDFFYCSVFNARKA